MQAISDLLAAEVHAIKNIPNTGDMEKAIILIHEMVHGKGGKLITSGVGKAGQIAMNIATTFSSTGTPAVFISPLEAQHGDLGMLQSNDILLLISNSGKTKEIIDLCALASNLITDVKIIVITSHSDTPLALQADVVINTGNPKELCPLEMTPTASTTTMKVIGDVLTVLMMEKIDFKVEEYAKRHHGGYLGTQSKAASQK